MIDLEIGGDDLGRIHARSNSNKYFCHFTGFLQGIVASGHVEKGEIEPLLAECVEFVNRVSDGDANDIIEDFSADLLSCGAVSDLANARHQEIDHLCERSTLNRFLGFCRGVVCDGVITIGEARSILDFLDTFPELLSETGVADIGLTCRDAVADGIVDGSESAEICEAIGRVVGDCYGDTGLSQVDGVANFEEFKFSDFEVEIEGAVVVVTGKLRDYSRKEFENRLSEFGATVARSITRKTDFIVVANEASRDWVEMNRGHKIRKAQELRLAQGTPMFVGEGQVIRLMDG